MSGDSQTLENTSSNAIVQEDASAEILEVGDEGLERISYYSIKHEMLDKSAEQVVANTVANPTLSETVALLIDGWDNMCPEERAVLTALLWTTNSNAIRKS
jgi:hypothetical protein